MTNDERKARRQALWHQAVFYAGCAFMVCWLVLIGYALASVG